MRRDEPNRLGRAADALIASYVRELVADDELDAAPAAALPAAPGRPLTTPLTPPADVAESRVEAAL